MTIPRRTFIRSGSVALAGVLAIPKGMHAFTFPPEILGLQLYSVRDDMGKDPKGTLTQVASAGYKYVEHASYTNRKFYGYSATDFKKILSDTGLDMVSGHTVMSMKDWDNSKNDFTDEWKFTIEDAATVGQRFVISPWLDESLRSDINGLNKFMELFNKCGQLCKSHGLTFGYHNHDFEFNTMVDHMKLYDFILKHTDPALVMQQLDVGNMYEAGAKALDVLHEYPGRFRLMHVKDEIASTQGKGEMGEKYESCVLGKGILPVKDIVDTGRKTGGTSYFIIEQESYQGKSPVECCRQDYTVMKSWGY
jgi:sugar phosphate isomerase/epimerase